METFEPRREGKRMCLPYLLDEEFWKVLSEYLGPPPSPSFPPLLLVSFLVPPLFFTLILPLLPLFHLSTLPLLHLNILPLSLPQCSMLSFLFLLVQALPSRQPGPRQLDRIVESVQHLSRCRGQTPQEVLRRLQKSQVDKRKDTEGVEDTKRVVADCSHPTMVH